MTTRRGPVHGLGCLAAVLVLAVTLTSGTAGATSGTAVPAQATTIRLLDQAPWQRLGDVLQLRVQVQGAPADATIRTERHGAVDSRTAFAETIEDDDELGSAERQVDVPLASLTPAEGGGVTLAYPMADDPGLDRFGVYPMRLLVVDGGGTTLAQLVTYLVVLPEEEFPPLSVAVLMEIGGPTGLRPDGSVPPNDEILTAVASRTEVLQGSPLPLTVAPSPETLDALGDMGDRGQQQLDELRTALADQLPLARPYVDLDLDAMVSANLLTQLPPEAEAGAQVVRTRFDLEPIGGTWLSGPTLGDAAAKALRDVGVPSAVVPESAIASVEDLDSGEVPTEPVALGEGGPRGFVADESLSTRLTGQEGALDAQRFLAELAVVWMTRPSVERGVLVRIPETAQLDVDTVAAALDGLAIGPTARTVTTQQLFNDLAPDEGEAAPTAELAPHTDAPDLRPLVEPLGQAQARVFGLAGTLDDSALIGSLQRSLLIALGSDTTERERRAYIGRVDAVVADIADKVSAPDEFTITLTARDGTIPLTLTNDTGQPIVVRVHLDSSQLTFPDGATRTEVLEPGTKRLDLDVRTRTSGAFPLDISVTSPDETIELDETTFTIRSTAVSGAGLFLSAGAGLFLLIWWARHWRTAKRSQRLVVEDR